ncbi:MAG: ABC transporter permease [Acidimicrobiales bacterium]|nr:ABC transporter permease [Acidimicrobiales bacterium]MCB9394066.1 ABC transporter permease [Acidimicrobiaceae bacterium]
MRLTVNPVLAREVKERMRGLWTFVVLMVFLGLLTLTVWVAHAATRSYDPFSFDLERQTRLGRDLFEWVLTIMIVLVMFFVPGLTAGAVAGERERQTLLPLQITLLKPRHILWGKVMASLAFLTLLEVASLPVLAVAYRLGGVTVADLVAGLAAVLVVGVLLATMIVGISSFAKRVQTATLLAYGFTMVVAVGSFVVAGVASVVDSNRGFDPSDPPAALLLPNPIVFAAVATAGENIDSGDGPLQALRQLVRDTHRANGGWWLGDGEVADGFDPNGGFVFVDDDGFLVDSPGPTTSAALMSFGSLAALAVALFALGCRRLRTPAETER